MRDKKLRKFIGYRDGDEESYYTLDRRISELEAIDKSLMRFLGYDVISRVYSCGCCFDVKIVPRRRKL